MPGLNVQEPALERLLNEQEAHLPSKEPIAIVGIGCRLPGSISNVEELWNLLSEKGTGYREFESNRLKLDGYYHPNYQRPGSIHTRGAFLLDEDPRLFDHNFFGINPTEVVTMDPVQRKMLEVTYEAFESAGEPWDQFTGSCTGVFVGNFSIDHHLMQMYDIDFTLPYSSTGGSTSILSNRINHIFNLRGPSVSIDTACSSSMYALHLAVNAIRNGDCDSAIVGGSNLILSPEMQQLTAKLGALSPTSTCHTFDASADGYARGEGFGALYLKRYSDAIGGNYPIRALIRGTAINSNGRTAGISHPGVEGQEALIRHAYRNAGLPTSMTGTPVGDPVEVAAVGRVFGPERMNSPLLIGSVKTNLGHSEAASGVTGIIKAILALERGVIPPTRGIQKLNPNIDLDAARVKIVTELTPWPVGLLKRVSVNSFGYGGANGHCILDHPETMHSPLHNGLINPPASNGHTLDSQRKGKEAESSKRDEDASFDSKANGAREPVVLPRRLFLLPLSAHEPESLKSIITDLDRSLDRLPLTDVAYTLSKRRSKFIHKTFHIADSESPRTGLTGHKLVTAVPVNSTSPRLGFVFTGQGAQWQEMGRGLFVYKVFRCSVQRQDAILATLSNRPAWKLENILAGSSTISVQDAAISQTLCTCFQIALCDLLRSWSIVPDVTIGHSSGEIAAAYAAGHLSLAEALVTAYCRGIAIARNNMTGAMLAVGMSESVIFPYLKGIESLVKIAAFNSPGSITLSGDTEDIASLQKKLQAEGVFTRMLNTGGNAYHSHHMAPVGEEYEALLQTALKEIRSFNDPTFHARNPLRPWISSVVPGKMLQRRSDNPEYWRRNLESPVQFSEAVAMLITGDPVNGLLEIGPHSALQSPLKQLIATHQQTGNPILLSYLPTIKRDEDGVRNLLELCGSLYLMNYPVDLATVNASEYVQDGCVRYSYGSVCTKLPKYRYKYGPPLFHEHRIAREIKNRPFLRHDLLGALQPGCAKQQPTWRNILRMKDVPWLSDHKLIPNPVLPGSAYPCLAIEAASQFLALNNKLPIDPCFRLRNVLIKTAMQIPDNDIGLEIMLTLRVSPSSPNWLEFSVSSVAQDGNSWVEHSSGMVSVVCSSAQDLERLDGRIDSRVIDVQDWYDRFTDFGLGYGKSFQDLSELRCDPTKNISKARIGLHSTRGMFKGPESSYVIHPASLDICNQLALIACHGGQTGRMRNAFVPVCYEEMAIWPSVFEEGWGQCIAQGTLKGLRGAHATIQLFGPSGKPMVDVRNLRCVSYHGGKGFQGSAQVNEFTRLVWKPDISTLSFDQAKTLFPPSVPSNINESTFEGFDRIAAYMAVEIAHQYTDIIPTEDHLCQFLQWVRRSATAKTSLVDEARLVSSERRMRSIADISSSLAHFVDIELIKRLFDNMADILNGQKTGVEIALQDGLLKRVYTSGIGISGAYPQLHRLLDLLGHRNPAMKVIEIGAGTGGATRVAMQALGGSTASKRYSKYYYTDISSAFLEVARSEFAACRHVKYETLDLNLSPDQQGFDTDFDLVIASECLHATRDIASTLRNVRELLKPGGRMILLETTRTIFGHGLLYGTFPDYWSDAEVEDSPFLSSDQWDHHLRTTGYSGIDIALDDYEAPFGIVSTMVTEAVDTSISSQHRETVYLVSENQNEDFTRALATAIRDRDTTPILTSVGCDLPQGCRVILTTDLEAQTLADASRDDFMLIKKVVQSASSILWLTPGLHASNAKTAVSTGLVRMLITENQESYYGIFHLELGHENKNGHITRLIAEREARLHRGDPEREFALFEGVININRLLLDDGLNNRHQSKYSSSRDPMELSLHEQRPVVAYFTTPGLLSSLVFQDDESFSEPLGAEYIEIKTSAVGLNWKDIAVSTGRNDMDNFSSEVAGVVTRCGSAVHGFQPGDRVYSLAWGKFGNMMRIPASIAIHASPKYALAELASVPLVFCSALYALKHLGRLQNRERLLIQSATGGLGLAAVQLARHLGAEIYATAGTKEKIDYLSDTCHIPGDRIFLSRKESEIAKLMAATGGKGFDVILSTSTGSMLHETWRLIAPRGRFIDVGRLDVQNASTMAMDIFARNATFSSFDLSTLYIQDRDFCAQLMHEVDDMLRKGTIRPIAPITRFDVSELDRALLYFSQGKHIGKVVVTYEDSASIVRMLPPMPQATFQSEVAYLIIGGLGALGRSIIQWMVCRGARHLVVCSRSGTPSPEASTMMRDLAARNVEVQLIPCDVTARADIDRVIGDIIADRPLRGIIHAAVTFCDQAFERLTYEQWRLGLSAKVTGTLNLHEITLERKLDLDFFVMTSSFEAILAMPTQSAYCAANSFQDAFARHRRSLGLPACAIAFGLITEIGDVGQRDITRNMIHRNDLYGTGELDFLRLFEAAFLEVPESTESWRSFDPLAEAQITTCLEPSKLAKMVSKRNPSSTEIPRWRQDKKFSHIVQAMLDQLSTDEQPLASKPSVPAIAAEVDIAISEDKRANATELITRAITGRVSGLLGMSVDTIDAAKSVAAYGVDSLIAVELRSWVVSTFGCAIPLLRLLDEGVSMVELGGWIMQQRVEKLEQEEAG